MIEYLIWITIPLFFYFNVIKPKQDAEKKAKSFKINDFVVTKFGLLGTIKLIKNDFVILSIAKSVDIKILISAIEEKRKINND